MFKYFIKLTTVVALITMLSACASSQTGIAVNLHSASYLNPDINGQASPVVVSIYQLKSPFTFNNSNYSALSANSEAILGMDLIDKQTVEVRPGENKVIHLQLSQSTQYIGIVAGYRRIDEAKWHTVLHVAKAKGSVAIAVNLESNGLSAHFN